jgi:3-isopropylmalate dehydrogenase
VLDGEGIGPEVLAVARRVLKALQETSGKPMEVRRFEGQAADPERGKALTPEFRSFCEGVFSAGGAILSGPVEGRFVYDFRRTFRLFCKLVPIRAYAELLGALPLRPKEAEGADILLVRENLSGVYHGESKLEVMPGGRRLARHESNYGEEEVRRIVEVAARLAQRRSGRLAVVIKDGGLPALSELWRAITIEVTRGTPVECAFINADLAGYWMLHKPRAADVIVAPNLFGDVLADLGGLVAGSRGITYSGNYSADGAAVYQTNHGSALDLAGTGTANPGGQLLSLAMMLRESFGWGRESVAVETTLRSLWAQGWRTADLMEPGCRLAGTQKIGALMEQSIRACLSPSLP